MTVVARVRDVGRARCRGVDDPDRASHRRCAIARVSDDRPLGFGGRAPFVCRVGERHRELLGFQQLRRTR